MVPTAGNGKEWKSIENYNHLNFRSGSQFLFFLPVICCFVTRIHRGLSRACCQIGLRLLFSEMAARPSFRWRLRNRSCWIPLFRAWNSIRFFLSYCWADFLLACGSVSETLGIPQAFLCSVELYNKQQSKWGFHQAFCGQNIANIMVRKWRDHKKGRPFTGQPYVLKEKLASLSIRLDCTIFDSRILDILGKETGYYGNLT